VKSQRQTHAANQATGDLFSTEQPQPETKPQTVSSIIACPHCAARVSCRDYITDVHMCPQRIASMQRDLELSGRRMRRSQPNLLSNIQEVETVAVAVPVAEPFSASDDDLPSFLFEEPNEPKEENQ